VNILGVRVSAINMQDALTEMERWILNREQHYICVCPNHTIMEGRRNPRLRQVVNNAGLVTPDGMSVVWVCWLYGYRRVERVYGPDLMEAFSALAAEKGYTNFYYGAAPGVPERLAERLCQKFPGLQVVGTYSPPFRPLTPGEDAQIVEMINAANPDVVWVGLSSPKQDFWMAEHVGRIKAPVMVGVGAAFDFLSGQKRQAPRWIQRNGLEWVWRLAQEPRRLWRRNLDTPPYFFKVLLQWTGLRKFD
jgi:N-acetylglucosaminyldiphosphoundecaprenol N-acetyl-beta-D-mannosaminyltransferase